jgi:hypothetical protein
MLMEWADTAGQVFVEFTYSLRDPIWTTVAGPLPGTNWVFSPVPGAPAGFYRLKCR